MVNFLAKEFFFQERFGSSHLRLCRSDPDLAKARARQFRFTGSDDLRRVNFEQRKLQLRRSGATRQND